MNSILFHIYKFFILNLDERVDAIEKQDKVGIRKIQMWFGYHSFLWFDKVKVNVRFLKTIMLEVPY